MAEQTKAKPGGDMRPKHRGKKNPDATLTLAEQNVDKNLAKAARAAARLSDAEHEKSIEEAKKLAEAAARGDKAIVRAAKDRRHAEKKRRRQEREKLLGDKIKALPTKKYGVIVADPEWKFEVYSERGLMNSGAANEYSVSDLEDIIKRDVPSISSKDCVLFLWATVPMLPQALQVMAAWGFKYKSSFVWIKDKVGTGYWARNKHEILLIGTTGSIVAPAEGSQPESAISAPVKSHSAKPEIFLEIIENWFPNIPKIELNRRGLARNGWDAWGNEAE
jgi:N6-adenosine-specific RNA methylase IME4